LAHALEVEDIVKMSVKDGDFFLFVKEEKKVPRKSSLVELAFIAFVSKINLRMQ